MLEGGEKAEEGTKVSKFQTHFTAGVMDVSLFLSKH